MKPILKLLTAPLLLLCGLAHAQVKTNFSNPDSSFNKTIKNIIEFSFFETYNKQGEYSYQFGNVIRINFGKLKPGKPSYVVFINNQ
jgi:hypothetical protein